MFKAIKKILPSRNERLMRAYRHQVDAINALEDEMRALDAAAIRARFDDIRTRLTTGKEEHKFLPEVFAMVREAARRTVNMRHFDVQLIGGMALNDGKIAEMQTGEGKTLAATLPACFNAACGRTVHIVTVNDYLVRRDSEWMKPIYDYLGLDVGVVVAGQDGRERMASYAASVTYGTNNEFGFDYLRDNMVLSKDERVQGALDYAIVDEVDSILIDEARTPLIISGPAERSEDMHAQAAGLVRKMKPEQSEGDGGDYTVDEKSRQVVLTDSGHRHVELLLQQAGLLNEGDSLYDIANIGMMHYINAALRAKTLFQRDVHYLVKDGRVLIVDEFTGRVMEGRRWSDGLHQAVEAKEGVAIQGENQTLASITFQNYFRLYDKLSGMTGTADTEAYEFQQIYNLEVAIIPTHMKMVREDLSDLVYLTIDEKYDAIAEDIKACVAGGRPVLVGTTSIESSERLSRMLDELKIAHRVLNAKHHESESVIIAQAGRTRSVTIATNMAGRGTDIVLGGSRDVSDADDEAISDEAWQRAHREVVEAGGLHIIGTERHESRRIDNQLRGRAGRQGDPGSSRFYLSMDDSLMRIFAGDRMRAIMGKVGIEKGEAIEHNLVSRAIENAQRKVEAHNFDIRKTLLEYDDTANEQRQEIYAFRNELLEVDSIHQDMHETIREVLEREVSACIVPGTVEEQWDLATLEKTMAEQYALNVPVRQWLKDDADMERADILERTTEIAMRIYDSEVPRDNEEPSSASAGNNDAAGVDNPDDASDDEWALMEKMLLLHVLDRHWKEHLAAMDYLRQGIGLRSFAQRNPKQEYKREAFNMFKTMMTNVDRDVVRHLLAMHAGKEHREAIITARKPAKMEFRHDSAADILNPPGSRPSDGLPDSLRTPGKRNGEPPGQTGQRQRPAGRPAVMPAMPIRRTHAKIKRNDPCFCGSGKKYKNCCGAQKDAQKNTQKGASSGL